jgi:hypothetical protein
LPAVAGAFDIAHAAVAAKLLLHLAALLLVFVIAGLFVVTFAAAAALLHATSCLLS